MSNFGSTQSGIKESVKISKKKLINSRRIPCKSKDFDKVKNKKQSNVALRV